MAKINKFLNSIEDFVRWFDCRTKIATKDIYKASKVSEYPHNMKDCRRLFFKKHKCRSFS